jgi:hypothetical protein
MNAWGRGYKFIYDMQNRDWNTVLPTNEYQNSFVDFDLTRVSTYQTGVLKTIDDFEFCLHAQNIEHDFTKLPSRVECKITELTNGNEQFVDNPTDGRDRQDTFEYNYDKNFDSILIKMEGVGVTSQFPNLYPGQATLSKETIAARIVPGHTFSNLRHVALYKEDLAQKLPTPTDALSGLKDLSLLTNQFNNDMFIDLIKILIIGFLPQHMVLLMIILLTQTIIN